MTYRKLALALAVAALAPLAGAQVVYNNIGIMTSFTPSSGWTIGNASSVEEALQFTVSQNTYLDFAEVAIWNPVTGVPTVNIAVMSDNGAGSPGSVLESISLTLPTGSGLQPLKHAEFSNATYLTVGTTYWFAISAPDSSTWTAWESNGTFGGVRAIDTGSVGFTDPWASVTNSSNLGGLRIYGTDGAAAVPEPSTYGLIGVVALSLLGVLRRRTARA